MLLFVSRESFMVLECVRIVHWLPYQVFFLISSTNSGLKRCNGKETCGQCWCLKPLISVATWYVRSDLHPSKFFNLVKTNGKSHWSELSSFILAGRRERGASQGYEVVNILLRNACFEANLTLSEPHWPHSFATAGAGTSSLTTCLVAIFFEPTDMHTRCGPLFCFQDA